MDERTVALVPKGAHDDAHPLFFGDRWRVIAMLGAGGMGSVYLARDVELDELVALKMINNDLAVHREMIERFRDEVRLSRSVSSPYVARTHDLGEHDGRFFLTMQYVEGEPLSARIKREGPLPLADLVRIAHDVCAGLDAVHAAGIVHRDLKPGNVLLAKDGRAVLTDFGIALRASHGHTDRSGTRTYAAPEQLAGGAVDARSDVYALGVMLYVAATGQKPAVPPDVRAVAPHLPDAFASIVARAMSLEPSKRYASAGAVYEALAPLAKSGARADSRLFDFVRSIARVARSVAIDLSCDGASEAVRDAVSQHIASRLAESGEVRAVGDRDAAEAVLEGTVCICDGSCALRLVLRSREGDVFWRATTEGGIAALPSLADAASTSVARAFGATVRAGSERAGFASDEAAELFMQARVEYRQMYRAHVERARELLDRIEQLEPENPTVLAWKAAVLTRLRFFRDAPDQARELVDRALALGSRDAVPHLALAETCLQDMRPVDAVGPLVTALRLAPGAFDARTSFTVFLAELGAFAPALRLVESLRLSEPAYVGILDVPMRMAGLRGRFDESRAIYESVRRDGNGIVRLHLAALRHATWKRDRDEYRQVMAKLDATHLDETSHSLFQAFRVAMLEGNLDARLVDTVVHDMTPRRRSLLFQLLCEISALVRDDLRFFESLDRGVASGLFDAPWLDGCPLFDPYRGSLHFETARRTVHHRAYEALVEIDRCLGEPP